MTLPGIKRIQRYKARCLSSGAYTWRYVLPESKARGLSLAPSLCCPLIRALPFLQKAPCFSSSGSWLGVEFSSLTTPHLTWSSFKAHSEDTYSKKPFPSPTLDAMVSELSVLSTSPMALGTLDVALQLLLNLSYVLHWAVSSWRAPLGREDKALHEHQDKWMNEWIGFTVIPHHLQCTQCGYSADCVCLSPLSECTQIGLCVSSQRESRNWACECAKGPGLEIKKPGFLSQTCYNPVVWTWKFLSLLGPSHTHL